jgi:hypothetical protein
MTGGEWDISDLPEWKQSSAEYVMACVSKDLRFSGQRTALTITVEDLRRFSEGM